MHHQSKLKSSRTLGGAPSAGAPAPVPWSGARARRPGRCRASAHAQRPPGTRPTAGWFPLATSIGSGSQGAARIPCDFGVNARGASGIVGFRIIIMTEISVIAVLDDPVRRRLYDYVSARGDGVSRSEAAQAAGIGRTLAAFHLDRL